MNHKKAGVLMVFLASALLLVFLITLHGFNQEIEALGCFPNSDCQKIENRLTFLHLAFGIFGFLFALGCYLIFFSRGEEAIIQRLEEDTRKKLTEEKFSLIMKGLDTFEQEVIRAIRQQPGITQNTLRLRVNFSKAKLSQVLSSLEKKQLIVRETQGKTLQVFLKEEW